MAVLKPYLTFAGNCREAMAFYKACLGGELEMMVVGELPAPGSIPAGLQHQILHAALNAGELEIMATDMQPEKLEQGNDIHLCVVCSSETELKTLWQNLSNGGVIKQPLQEMFFGWIGTFTDRFGKRWMLECNKPGQH